MDTQFYWVKYVSSTLWEMNESERIICDDPFILKDY